MARAFQKRSRPQQLTLCQSLHAKALQATASEGLAQGPYMVVRAGFKPMTLRSKGVVSANAPPCPIIQLKLLIVHVLKFRLLLICYRGALLSSSRGAQLSTEGSVFTDSRPPSKAKKKKSLINASYPWIGCLQR